VNYLQQQLDERRRKLRLSYPKLEELTGIPRSTLWNIVNGPMRQTPKKEHIELLAKALNWQPEFLLQMVGEQFDFVVYHQESRGLRIISAAWEKLSEKEQRGIVAQVEELLRNNDDADQ
jgi:transcriptional regulator with XRE-family HTH domain